ncbi:MAG: VWA domain-containing protein [Terracidiphilus sp.]
MRRGILLFLLAAATIPATAAKRETVAQLEQTLAAAYASHKQDAEIARQIIGMELSERLTEDTLRRLSTQMVPGSQAVLALELLADQSAFLDPPPGELPPIAAPDAAAQQRMLESALRYGAKVLPGLPNFLATRTINRYDDSPQAQKKGDWAVRAGLHLVDTSSKEISVRAERDDQPSTQDSAVWEQRIGLISGGEFGSTLGMILADMGKGSVTWSHWEQTGSGATAVFRYSVPRSASHFEIISVLELDRLYEGVGTPRGGSTVPGRNVEANRNPSGTLVVRVKPAYHGSLWLDPDSGTILRITIEADNKESASFRRAELLVEYAPVEIGDSKFVCPVRSIALSDAVPDASDVMKDTPTRWLNVSLFTGYHRFASTTRILSGTLEAQSGKPEGASEVSRIIPPESNETASATGKLLAQPGVSSTISTPDSAPTPVDSTPPVSTSTESNASTPTQPVFAPTASTAAVSTPSESVAPASVANHADEPQAAAQTIQVNVNRVLVPVVVRDKSGRTVSGLKKEDFTVFDNDAPRPIIGFTLEQRGAESNGSGNTSSHSPASPSANAGPQPVGQRFIVFLFDDLHLGPEDLVRVKNAGAQVLDGALSPSDIAVVLSLSGNTNSGLTRDHAILRKAIMSIQTRNTFRPDPRACPNISYYQAVQIENEHGHDGPAFKDAYGQVLTCNPSLDPARQQNVIENEVVTTTNRVLNLGRQDALITYSYIAEFVRTIGTLPGQRMVIFVSPGFVALEQESIDFESRVMDLATQSNVTVSVLDARGLYVGDLSADATQAGPMMTGSTVQQQSDYHRSSMLIADSTMAALAAGTGGTFFHNSNDLGAGFQRLTEPPEVVYVLELSPDKVKQDGSYHRLKVKVDRPSVDIQARRGYFIPKPEKKKK